MRPSKAFAVLSTLALATSLVIRDVEEDEDRCEVTWVTVTVDAIPSSSSTGGTIQSSPDSNTDAQASSSSSSAAAASSQVAATTSSVAAVASTSTTQSAGSQPTAGSGSSANATSALDLSDVHLPGGQAPIPINDDYIHAPEDNTPVPADAVVFTPTDPGIFDCSAFATWRDHYRDNPPPSKFLKIAPGAYRYKLGPKLNPGDDPNNTVGENLIMYLMKGGWTLDLRGVTFYIDFTPDNLLQRPSVLVYTLQSDNLTVIGGTIWSDWGEQYSQARVTSISGSTATFQVEQGYNTSVWRSAGPRNQGCVDPSDPNHYTFAGCNFWKVDTYNFDNLDSDRTFTANLLGGDGLAEGIVVTMMNGLNSLNSMFTLSNEANTNLHVIGMTSNGGFMSIGLDDGQFPPRFTNCYSVNPPPRPGFAPRVNGPLIAWANTNLGAIYNEPNRPTAIFENSFFQYTGSAKDLWDTSDADNVPR